MAELTNRDERSAKFAQAKETYRRTGELPPGKLDVIYIGGIPPLRQVWRDMKAIIKERRDESRNGAADGIERGGERRETETMTEPVGREEWAAKPDQAERPEKSGELPPGKLDVIYIGGFPPVWKIWRKKGMVTIQPRESRRER